MKKKLILKLLLVICCPVLLHAQQEERLLYKIKKTIYSKVTGQEGSNINITLLIYESQTFKIALTSLVSGTLHNDTTVVHELSDLPVQNLVVQKLRTNGIGTAGQTAQEILESQSLSTISLLVFEANAFLTSKNNVNRNDITGAFSFKTKIPIFIDADSANIRKLFEIVGYSSQEKSADSSIIEASLKTKIPQADSISQHIGRLSIERETPERNTQINALREQLQGLQKSITSDREDLYLIQKMTSKSKKIKYLVGYAFVKRNEIVIDRGFIKATRMVLQDNIELRYRFGGGKMALSKLYINKILDYNFSLDIRSVSAAHRSLEIYPALWKFTTSGLNFWTSLAQVFTYDPPDDADITDLFVVRRQRVIFDADSTAVKRVKETDINNVVQLNVFTDLVGVQEDQPNGLIQVEGEFKTHLFAWTRQIRYRHTRMYALDHLIANLRFAKIENKLRYLDASVINGGGSNVTFIPSFQLLQYANLEAGVKISALKVISYKREFNLYYNPSILRTGLRDTIIQTKGPDTTKIPRTYNIITFKQSLQAHLKIKATSYMGVDVSAQLVWLKLLDSDIKQSGGNFSREGNTFSGFSTKKNVLINPQFQVYYMPNKDESKRLYLRCGFMHDLGTKSNNYLSIQVGLSSDINRFLNFKGQDQP